MHASEPLLRQILAADLEIISAGGQDVWSRLMVMALHVALKREQAGFHTSQAVKKADSGKLRRLSPQRQQEIRQLYPGVTPAGIASITSFMLSFGQTAFSPEARRIIEQGIQAFCQQLNEGQPFQIAPELWPQLQKQFYKLISLGMHTANREDIIFTRLSKYTQIFAQEEPEAYAAIKLAIATFEVNTGYPLHDQTDDVIYFLLANLPELCHKTVALQVILLGDFGLESEQFIARYIADTFKSTDRVNLLVHCYSQKRPPQKSALAQADLFLTTVIKSEPVHRHTVLLEDYPSLKTLQVIRREIQAIRREKITLPRPEQSGCRLSPQEAEGGYIAPWRKIVR
ncbi:MAG: hypothetical protein PHP39_06405 [Oscillospiraceae bacterium]|nr:hypothetical protein [Oscillospiraceae bacterium]